MADADDNLARLAGLVAQRNALEQQITEITGRPAALGHLGEYVAARIFDIDLAKSASHKSLDGWFRTGPLAGRSVNIKWYALQEGMLDITPDALPDTYLVLSGPASTAVTSRGVTRPWLIESVYLFEAGPLVAALRELGVKLGIATSVRRPFWELAQVYPEQTNALLRLSEDQCRWLALSGQQS